METAKTLYSNIVALLAIVTTALIVAGMPLFYGIDATIDIAATIGVFAGVTLTAGSLIAKLRGNNRKPAVARARSKKT